MTELPPQTIAAMTKANADGLALANRIVNECENTRDVIAALLTATAAMVAVTAGMRHLSMPGSTSEFAPHGLAVLDQLRKDIEDNMRQRTFQ